MKDAILMNSEKLAMRLAERGVSFSKSLDSATLIGTIRLSDVVEGRMSRNDLEDTLGTCGMWGEVDSANDVIRISER